MSVQALSCAFAVRGLSPSEKLVLLALANFANDKMQCWPSQDRLADDTELSPRTVWGALKALEGRLVLSRTSRKRSDGTRATDVFTLHFSFELGLEPIANPAKTNRKPCENQSQTLREPIAAVATLTTFEPSITEPSEDEPLSVTPSATEPDREESAWVRFWSAYPRKVDKAAARKAFRTAWKKLPAFDEEAIISGGLERAKAGWDDPKFIPHAATWLNHERWNDEQPVTQARDHERSYSDQAPPSPRQDRLGRSLAGLMAAVDEREPELDRSCDGTRGRH